MPRRALPEQSLHRSPNIVNALMQIYSNQVSIVSRGLPWHTDPVGGLSGLLFDPLQ
jgi:hypothetical protein